MTFIHKLLPCLNNSFFLSDLQETDLPLEVKKVVVRTKEDVEPSMKLKSSNAIFYMTFKAHRGPEWKAIIRQTRDGIQGHVCLEVTCMHVGKVV